MKEFGNLSMVDFSGLDYIKKYLGIFTLTEKAPGMHTPKLETVENTN